MNDQMGGWSVAFCRTWNVTSQFGLGLGMFACSTQITLPLCCWHVFQWGVKKSGFCELAVFFNNSYFLYSHATE